jgi:hypothetical protein
MHRLLATSMALFLGLAFAAAQAAEPADPLLTEPCFADEFAGDACCCKLPTVTARLEYLMWWSRGRNTPPLVSTSPQGTPRDEAGVLGFANTTVLYVDDPIGEDFRSGGRASLSFLVADCLWTEGRVWGLQDGSETFFAASDGDPILARPFFNVVLGQEDSLLVAFPGVVTDGSVTVRSRNDLFGADAWIRETWAVDCGARIDLVAGYQFTRLDDSLRIDSRHTSIDPGAIVPIGTVFDVHDLFATHNEFHGGQLGLAGEYHGRCWTLELLAKVGLGAMMQQVLIDGRTTLIEPNAAPITSAGGLLAQPTNMGAYDRTRLAFIPEVNANLAYDVNPCWRVSVGYSFLYWSNVVLAGNQIDRAVNLSQNAGPLIGPARPAFDFHRTDYWVQGINVGVQYRW